MSILLSLLLGAKLGAMFSVRCMAGTKWRGWGEDSIYFDHASGCRDRQHHRGCPGRWRGSISLGFGPDGRRVRRKVSGQTKTEVKDKLQLLHDELREGVRSSPKYTVQNAVEDWLAQALDGRAAKTISTNREGPRTLDRADRGCEAQGTHGGGSQVGSGAACNHSFYQSRADDPQQPCPGHPLCRGE